MAMRRARPPSEASSSQPYLNLSGMVLNNRFKILNPIGGGSFGDVYAGIDLQTNLEVAAKVDAPKQSSTLSREVEIYHLIQGAVGIPRCIDSVYLPDYQVLIMDLLGPSLEDLLVFCGRAFSLKTALMIADQMIVRVEHVHSKSFLHRDIKPDNYVIGRGPTESVLFLIDYGLSKRFKEKDTGVHIKQRTGKQLTGTARYASIRNHQGVEQSRRDDLESIGYVLVYLLKGRLPWQGVQGDDKREKYRRIGELKESIPLGTLCEGLPPAFAQYIDYCRKLKFKSKPDYLYLRTLFSDLFYSRGYRYDNVFDWDEKKMKEGLSSIPKRNKATRRFKKPSKPKPA